MDFSLSKCNISNIASVCDSNISQNIDSDIALPEYIDDIETVLSCTLTGEIESSNFNDGRVTVEGIGLIRLIYTSKSGTLHCFETAVPFSRFAETPNITPEDCLGVSAQTQYVNCRLVNPRRFDVHGNIVLRINASRIINHEIVSSALGAALQTKTQSFEISNACCVNEKSFTLNEMLEISPDLPPIAQIISITASPDIADTKLISQKALVKGDMTVNLVYLADEKESRVCKTEFILPISQVTETPGSDEGCRCITKATVNAVSCEIRADSDGATRLVDITVNARARISVYKDEEINAVTDVYSTEYETECEIKKLETRHIREQFTDTCLCRNSFSSPGKEIKEIVAIMTRDLTCEAACRDNRLIISGTVRAGLIVEYRDGEIGFIEKQLDYEYSREETCENVICDKSVRVNASSFFLTSPTNADVRVEIEIEACIFETHYITPVVGISVKEDCIKKPCRTALTLYYPSENESVWNIAKRYNTTVSAIIDENQLADGVIESGRMLLIPRM